MQKWLMSRTQGFDRNSRAIALASILVASLLLAYVNRFVQDDAFISFRYASHLVHGEGLVWNPGERVEGYTNFLWTLLMSVPIALGHDVVLFSQLMGFLAFLGSLWVTFELARLIFGSDATALLATLLLGTNYSFSAYATGGLETQLQAFLVVTVLYLVIKSRPEADRPLPAAGLSLLAASALMVRLDSIVIIAPAFVLLAWSLGKNKSYAALAASLVPGAIVLVAWFVWKYTYYGSVLPNSYYAKAAASVASLRLGVAYVFHFVVSYFLFPFVIIAPFRARKLLQPTGARLLVVILAAWMIYIVRVGGDFMEFRFMVPVLPLTMILLARLITTFERRTTRIALIVLVLAGSVWHAAAFRSISGISPIGELAAYIEDEDKNWDGIGRTLGRLFAGEPGEVTIATSAAGAIPYYSDLRTVDMLGVNDRWIARNGTIWSPRPGHQRIATHRYLVDRGVNLVIGHPRVDPTGAPPRTEYSPNDLDWIVHLWVIDPDLLDSNASILEIPIDNNYKLSVLYLVQSEAVDRVIKRNGLTVHPLFPSAGEPEAE
jgi:arabinofuranosyltransferase